MHPDEDLIVHGYKVVGSAQRKSRHSILQHGSVLLRASRWAPQLPGIEDLTASTIPIESLVESFSERLGLLMAIDWRSEPLAELERKRSDELVCEKFATDRWHRRR